MLLLHVFFFFFFYELSWTLLKAARMKDALAVLSSKHTPLSLTAAIKLMFSQQWHIFSFLLQTLKKMTSNWNYLLEKNKKRADQCVAFSPPQLLSAQMRNVRGRGCRTKDEESNVFLYRMLQARSSEDNTKPIKRRTQHILYERGDWQVESAAWLMWQPLRKGYGSRGSSNVSKTWRRNQSPEKGSTQERW